MKGNACPGVFEARCRLVCGLLYIQGRLCPSGAAAKSAATTEKVEMSDNIYLPRDPRMNTIPIPGYYALVCGENSLAQASP
jgi:hypothetical protein